MSRSHVWMVCLFGCGVSSPPLQSAAVPTTEEVANRRQKDPPPGDCGDLLALSLADTVVTSATVVAADPDSGLPEYCDLLAKKGGTITVNVRLPMSGWNGKVYFGGNGGFAGRIRRDTSDGLSRNYATISTDTGHTILDPDLDIFDASWALNNLPAEIDFGYRAVHESTVVGKKVVRAFYGRAPTRAYFDGCSNGGRQALQEASRFPEDYDGIIAGAPVTDETGLMIGFVWNMEALHAGPNISDIPVEKLGVIGNAVLAGCDGLDGLTDGLIDDPRKCHFDPGSLLCSGGDAPDCLTTTQVDALRQIYRGPSSSAGAQLYPGFLPGGETPDLSFNGWDAWLVSNADFPSFQFIFMDEFLRYLAFHPDRPTFDFHALDFDRAAREMAATARLLDPSDDLEEFQRSGGKLLIYQGWSDAAQTAPRTIEYFRQVQRHAHGRHDAFARLFMVPGMFHCSDGPGPNRFDSLGALEAWVEQGHAPESMVATHVSDDTGEVDRTRPLCPYPQVARYRGSGDVNDASSFRCTGGHAFDEEP